MEAKHFFKWLGISAVIAAMIYVFFLHYLASYFQQIATQWRFEFLTINLINLCVVIACWQIWRHQKGLLATAFGCFLVSTLCKIFSNTKFPLALLATNLDVVNAFESVLGATDIAGFILLSVACFKCGMGKSRFFTLLPLLVMVVSALTFLALSNHWYVGPGGLSTVQIFFAHGLLLFIILVVVLLACTRNGDLLLFYVGYLLVFGSLAYVKGVYGVRIESSKPIFILLFFVGKISVLIGAWNFSKMRKTELTQLFYAVNSIRAQVILWSISAGTILFFMLSFGYSSVDSESFIRISVPLFDWFLIPFSLLMRFIADYLTKPLQELLRWIDLVVSHRIQHFPRVGFLVDIQEFGILQMHLESAFSKIQMQTQHEKWLFDIAAKTVHDVRSPLLVLAMMKESVNQHLTQEKQELFSNSLVRIQSIISELLSQYRAVKTGQALQVSGKKPEWIAILLMMVLNEKRVQYPTLELASIIEPSAWMAQAAIVSVDYLRILSNLIDNTIEAGATHIQCALQRGKMESYWQLEIQDNGCGMTQEQVRKALQGKLETSKKTGSGIGLSAAIDKVQTWGCVVEIDSRLQEGTTLRMLLPSLPLPTCFIDQIDCRPYQRIVILDDQAIYHEQWEKRFMETGLLSRVVCVHCYTAAEWVTALQEQLPDTLYLMDYFLGDAVGDVGQTGIELIVAHGLQAQSILVTNNYDEEAVIQACLQTQIMMMPKLLIPIIQMQ